MRSTRLPVHPFQGSRVQMSYVYRVERASASTIALLLEPYATPAIAYDEKSYELQLRLLQRPAPRPSEPSISSRQLCGRRLGLLT